MHNPIFKKGDFILCDVPVPKGYPQSQTHSGIVYNKGVFYLTCSPYPLKKNGRINSYWHTFLRRLSKGHLGNYIDADSFENPLLYIGENNTNGYPTKFNLMTPAPLMDKPLSKPGIQAYNSDPDIFIEDDRLYILNRTYYRKKKEDGCLEQNTEITLIEGSIGECVAIKSKSLLIKLNEPLLSPCLTKYRGRYILFYVDSNSALDGNTFGGIYMSTESSIVALQNLPNKKRVNMDQYDLLPWHMSLFTYRNKLYAIIACVEKGNKGHIWQMLGAFDDSLDSLHIYSTPLTDYNSYRGAACVLDDGTFILYSTTLHERIRGAKSIDGRDIIMTTIKFDDLIKRLSDADR